MPDGPTDAQRKAYSDLGDAVRAFVASTAEGGDETVVNAILLFEAGGINPDGSRFTRLDWCFPEEYSQTVTAAMGLMTVLVPQVQSEIMGGFHGACSCDED